ncbi:DUF3800 domain-containing protein [Pedobacter sp. AW31-3R]|uniref:DUF3800 domain-containing protein n=1 Tax=Pedobacter sp. AW31-3R TaxID=3445781 RepID=UPI003FA08C94
MIYFDEAGNTGGNLLDNNQPTYLLLSHNFSLDETEEVLKPLSEVTKAQELHFSKVKKYHNHRKELIKCLNHPLIQPNRVCYYVADKKFMIAIQMVDQLMEPVLYAGGVDIYQYGSNLSTANMLHISGTVIWDKKSYSEMGELFVKFLRAPTKENCIPFYRSVYKLRSSLSRENGMLLDFILMSEHHLGTIVPALTKYTLDPTLSCFNAHCQFWAKLYKKPFDITFDQSKQIDYWRDLIDFLTLHLPEGEVGFGSRKYKYPLLIESLQLDDSKNSKQLQLADLFASSLNYMFGGWTKQSEDEFSIEINKSLLHKNGYELKMWPTTDVTPEALDMTDGSGINPLDFIAEAATKKPSEYKKSFK